MVGGLYLIFTKYHTLPQFMIIYDYFMISYGRMTIRII